MAPIDFQTSLTYTNVPRADRQAWVRKLQSFPPAWLKEPAAGEVFDSHTQCLARLNAWGLFQGFLVVTGRTRKDSGKENYQFRCSHHGAETRNDRGLETKVERDSEGTIISDRKRDTLHNKKDCKWEYYLSFRALKRGDDKKVYLGRVVSTAHSHGINDNPMFYSEHKRHINESQQQQVVARKCRTLHLPYSKAVEFMKEEGLGMLVTSKEYYNLIRHKYGDKS